MRDDYLHESRRLCALAQTLEIVARTLQQTPDRRAAVACAMLAELALVQLDSMDKALDTLIEAGRAGRAG